MTDLTAIGARLREARERRKLSLRNTQDLTGYSKSALQRAEAKGEATIKMVADLAFLYKTHLARIIFSDEEIRTLIVLTGLATEDLLNWIDELHGAAKKHKNAD